MLVGKAAAAFSEQDTQFFLGVGGSMKSGSVTLLIFWRNIKQRTHRLGIEMRFWLKSQLVQSGFDRLWVAKIRGGGKLRWLRFCDSSNFQDP